MPIRISDLIDEGVAVQVRCTGCGNTLFYRGRNGLSLLGAKSLRLRDLQARLRYSKCRHLGEVIVTLPQTIIDDHRRVASPISPHAKIGGPLWRWD